ncbi:MBL fold metallo-hydrolase [Paracoccus sp. TK19116]|uniref:MBL fold metallo-hydrolase n=1 Tax=Paracoccus albicereus TaxID=2922394 RepID=A0ABT1MQM2_9RHOB|nr:MBL fold metallo-hydrolase [Paracoccus albicereus]MCQ0970592.1 MBL fold metallo-hydrolase [Paracoccus albicereus]
MIRATILGCGSSGGVPRIGDRWGACDPANPKNRRRRCSLLVERIGPGGTTRVLIDTGPDLVVQMLDAGVETVDAVVYTHAHADHIHGIDDLRQLAYNAGERLQAWADAPTTQALSERFGYIFETPPGSGYPPVADLNPIEGPFQINGNGGALTFQPIPVQHGRITALGFRIGGLVYVPDVSDISETSWPLVERADVFICDALRDTPHPSHAHLALTLEWMERAAPARGIITNMHIDLDYQAVTDATPDHIQPAFDGMVIEIGAGTTEG